MDDRTELVDRLREIANDWDVAPPNTGEPGDRATIHEAAATIRDLQAKLGEAREALRPFANAAMGGETFDPDFPLDGAALRASFDWYDRVQNEPMKRHSVRRSDLESARTTLARIGGMSDPVFQTRAELVAWARRAFNLVALQMEAKEESGIAAENIETIRRVTLAHSHLED